MRATTIRGAAPTAGRLPREALGKGRIAAIAVVAGIEAEGVVRAGCVRLAPTRASPVATLLAA